MSSTPRIVVVTRPTEFEILLERHGTAEQAAFFLKSRGQSLDPVRKRHEHFGDILTAVSQAIPVKWRRTAVGRQELSRFVFEPDDVVVAVGQDGLVPNVAKYLDGQPVVGVNPAPDQFQGVLVCHRAETIQRVLASLQDQRVQERTMVEVSLDDGQTLVALNEAFVGHVSHQSARYRIRFRGQEERQSSSGLIVSTGTGATGWSKSIVQERSEALALPTPASPSLAFLVREAFPSVGLGTELVQGIIDDGESLEIICEQESGATVFGDGMEEDRLEPRWGQTLQIRVAPKRLRLVV